MEEVKRQEHTCLKCGWRWLSKLAHPRVCPKCQNRKWDGAERKIRKPATNRNTTKRGQIKSLYTATPRPTLEQIGNQFGISRERVRQILRSEGVDTHHKMTCSSCGKPQRHRGICKECRYKMTHTLLTCSVCNKEFYRKNSSIKSRKKNTGINYKTDMIFCSKSCQGIYTGEHHGFTAHPENCGNRTCTSKYTELLPEAIELAKQGLWLAEIGRRLNMERAIYYKHVRSQLQANVAIPLKPRRDRTPRSARKSPTNIPALIPAVALMVRQGKSLYRIAVDLRIGESSLYKYKTQILELANKKGE